MAPKKTTNDNRLTNLIKHLVALIEDEHSDTAKTEVLVADKGVQAARCADNDVGVGILVLEYLGILLDRSTTVEDAGLDVGHVLAEAVVLVANLEGQLTGVAHNQHGALAGNRLDLLEGREDEDGSLTETGLGLADDVTTKHSLGNGGLLNCSRASD